MSETGEPTFFKRLILTLWAFFTLLLVCAVVMLGYGVTELGEHRIAIPTDRAELPEPPRAPESTTTGGAQEIRLYFAEADGRLLTPERRRMELSNVTVENCRTVIEALVHGPRDLLTPILPESVQVRAVYLLDTGELVVDFSRELVLDRKNSVSAEGLMIYGTVNTVTQRALAGAHGGLVRTVRFLIEGAPPGEAYRWHLDLNEPIAPDPRWIAGWQGIEAADG